MLNGTQIVHLISAGCKRAGISVNRIYRKSGLNPSLYFKWSHGSDQPSPRSIDRLRTGMLRSAAALILTSTQLKRAVAAENRAAMQVDIRDDLFGMCSLIAYGEKYYELGRHPDAETVRVRAYELYEQENAREKEVVHEQAY